MPLFQNFNDNPYFEDTKLTKTFTYIDGETTKITGTPVKWKEGMVFTAFATLALVFFFLSSFLPS